MRIAIIAEVFLPKVDGVVIRTMNLIRHLLERGDEILVLCPHAEGRADSPVPVVEFRSFPFPAYPEYRIGLPDKQVVTALEEFKPDLLHYLNPFAFGFRCADIIAKSGIELPSVYSFHTLYGEFVKQYPLMNPLSRVLWWLMRDYHNRADRNLTVSAIMQQDLIDRGFERVELWPPAVNCSLFDPGRGTPEMRDRLSGGQPDRPLLITVSRLAPEKNVEFLADVLRRIPDARLAVIGDGPDRASLERRFKGTNTEFFGYMQGEELATAYASSDAFVYASETETMGNVVLEAMASGLGVVAPRAGGIPSLVTHDENGLLYAPRDTNDAVSAVQRVLNDPAFRSGLSQSARRTVEEWGWNRSVERVRQHYVETIEQFTSRNQVGSRTHTVGPALTRMLVMAFRAMSLVSRRNAETDRLPRMDSSTTVPEQLLNHQGGLNVRRTEHAGT
ncbi:MAG: glycosyltransferase family 4 protein [Planctomycetota bacterium]|jgi:glycosyltransferase involved in cell wall biosynthesis